MGDESKEQGEAMVWARGEDGGQSDSSICPRAVQQGGLKIWGLTAQFGAGSK